MSDPLLRATRPPFIPEPLLILPNSFVHRHVLLTYPFVIAIGISLPLDQVLSGSPSPLVAHVQNPLDLVLFLIGYKVGGRTLIVPSMERSLLVRRQQICMEHRVKPPGGW